MSTDSGTGSAAPPLSLGRQVNAACDRLEAAWRAGARPRLEDYLAGRPATAGQALLAELLALELAYRVRDGEVPAAERYGARFLGHDALVAEAFRTLDPSTVRLAPIPDRITVPGGAAPRGGRPGGASDGHASWLGRRPRGRAWPTIAWLDGDLIGGSGSKAGPGTRPRG